MVVRLIITFILIFLMTLSTAEVIAVPATGRPQETYTTNNEYLSNQGSCTSSLLLSLLLLNGDEFIADSSQLHLDKKNFLPFYTRLKYNTALIAVHAKAVEIYKEEPSSDSSPVSYYVYSLRKIIL